MYSAALVFKTNTFQYLNVHMKHTSKYFFEYANNILDYIYVYIYIYIYIFIYHILDCVYLVYFISYANAVLIEINIQSKVI